MKKILLVEDDTSIRELLVEIFELEGYEVHSSSNGLEGIACLEKQIPDVILMDIFMPVMDGFAFRKEQMENPAWQLIPTIAMSAQNQKKEELQILELTNFISKPLELDQLLETIRNLT